MLWIDLIFKKLAIKKCLREANAYINSPNSIFINLGIDEDFTLTKNIIRALIFRKNLIF
ncbi:DUF261 family protein [Borreliella andersonii]|uniref:DUF261 family protein n=1 Tax=Borrelia andersonii TaxID=42109 RepID=UPI003AB6BEC8